MPADRGPSVPQPPARGDAEIDYPTLLSPETLASLLAGSEAATLRLIHVASADAFADGHLPGALLVQPGELVDGRAPAPGRLPDRARLQALFGRLGYTGDEIFVVCDDEGGGWAGRFAWTLDVIGHARWAYLDGGIHAWVASGGAIERGACHYPAPTTPTLSIDPAPIAGIEDVLDAIDDPGQTIWDVRSRDEFLGLRSGSARAGHIPGAIHLDWMRLKDPERATRLVENLPELLSAHGIDPGKPTITHCQTHHRSGLSYMVGRLLGFTRIRAYPGSWAEWGNRDDLPVATDS
ncbi:MAG: sulfurtransferase [Pseudomonadales bacterium]